MKDKNISEKIGKGDNKQLKKEQRRTESKKRIGGAGTEIVKKTERLLVNISHELRFLSYLSFVLACFFSLVITYSVGLIVITSMIFLVLSLLSYEDIFMKRKIYRGSFLLSSEEYVYRPLLCVSLLSFYYSQYSLRFSYSVTLLLFVVAYCLVLGGIERKKGKTIRKRRMTETIHYLFYGRALISLWSLYGLVLG